MSAHATQAERSTAFLRSPWTAPLLVFIAACFALVVVGVLTKQIKQDDPGPYRTAAVETIGFTMNGHEAAPAPASPLGPAFAPTLRALLKELLKQAIDQPGHFLIAALPILLSRYLTGAPWYGWPVVPLLAYREWLQWPSNRWWDPPLDWACLALGVIVATWALGALRRPPTLSPGKTTRAPRAPAPRARPSPKRPLARPEFDSLESTTH
ncbi:MAG: hypothetical protein ACREJ5_22645 [Geminicoccaceae bacterium]